MLEKIKKLFKFNNKDKIKENNNEHKFSDYLNINNYLNYFIEHKEKIIIISTILGVLFQILIIIFWFWIEWLPFISLKFSLVLISIFLFWIILWWLFSLIVLLLIIILSILLWFKLWYFWSIMLLIIFMMYFIDKKYSFWFKQKLNNFEKKYTKFLVINTTLLIVSTILFTILWLILEKPIKIFSWSKVIIWKMVFYNQDNYFIESCWKRIIIPSKNVNKIEFLCPWYKCKDKNIDKIYSKYCKNIPFNF